MPCNNGGGSTSSSGEDRIVYRDKIVDNPKDRQTIEDYKTTILYLSACLCALLSELEKTKHGKATIKKAEVNGKVDINTFWENHKKSDIERIKVELSRYSEHELEIVKQLLNKTE